METYLVRPLKPPTFSSYVAPLSAHGEYGLTWGEPGLGTLGSLGEPGLGDRFRLAWDGRFSRHIIAECR